MSSGTSACGRSSALWVGTSSGSGSARCSLTASACASACIAVVGSWTPTASGSREIAFLRSCGVCPWNCSVHETYVGKVAIATASVVIATVMGQKCRCRHKSLIGLLGLLDGHNDTRAPEVTASDPAPNPLLVLDVVLAELPLEV